MNGRTRVALEKAVTITALSCLFLIVAVKIGAAQMKTKIYALLDENQKPRYIGKTIRPLRTRLMFHIYESQRGIQSHKGNWIRSMFSRGLTPTILLLKSVLDNGSACEITFIKHFKEEGFQLTNGTAGGEGLPSDYIPSKETCLKISMSHMGRLFSEETKRKMSESQKKYWLTKRRFE